ncbi:MAG: hypothetical protein L6V93_05695 [Clostridiales bacterium]|nr:MAG: hypothetical protein L6V93_05695 [Clostridiales bacterium]
MISEIKQLDSDRETTTIGSFNGKRFLGTFEGLGHKISNVTVNVTSGYQSVGFFGRLSGKVKNTGFESLDIKTRENTNNIAVGSICSILDNGAEIINWYVKKMQVSDFRQTEVKILHIWAEYQE